MDAAQMLTAQEIARQCEQLARTVQRERSEEAAPRPRHLSVADPITQPIERIVTPGEAPAKEDTAAHVTGGDLVDSSGALTDRELEVLAFERQWWKRPGGKEKAIRELFDMSASRYYQVLNAVADKPEAVRVDPMLIKRLRKVRASRQRARHVRRLGIELH
jgi:hypothetical protein